MEEHVLEVDQLIDIDEEIPDREVEIDVAILANVYEVQIVQGIIVIVIILVFVDLDQDLELE